jgi:hypothetical protein
MVALLAADEENDLRVANKSYKRVMLGVMNKPTLGSKPLSRTSAGGGR